jgi:membrane protein required for colicin V production
MSWFDIIVVCMILFGAYRGYKEGFLMELFSLLAIVLGILGAFKLLGVALIFLTERFDIDEKILPYVAFGVVFLIIVIVVTLIGRTLRLSIDKSFLGRVDQIAGSLLGAVKTLFMVSVALWIVSSLKVNFPEHWTDSSKLAPWVSAFAPNVTEWVGEYVPVFKDLF